MRSLAGKYLTMKATRFISEVNFPIYLFSAVQVPDEYLSQYLLLNWKGKALLAVMYSRKIIKIRSPSGS